MKQTRFFLMASVALLSVGLFSCGSSGGGDNSERFEEWVDLGLPSGLLWASCNIGANRPEEYGDYFAWGEVTAKDCYGFKTYRHCIYDNGAYRLNKYFCDDSLTILQADDDVATLVLGNGARMPTKEEWEELIDNTTISKTTLHGVKGRMFTAPNGKRLFLPAAGCRDDEELPDTASGCYYWSSTLCDQGYGFYSWAFFSRYMDGPQRFYGLSVRAVRQK